MNATGEQTCSNCGTAHDADDIFCESCGYDFITGSLPSAEEASRLGLAPVAGGPDPHGSTPVVGSLPVGPRVRFEIAIDPAYFKAVVSEGELDLPDPLPAAQELERVGSELHIGRTSQSRAIHPDLDIAELTGDPAVSSRHAVIRVDGAGVVSVTDVGSTNGTTVGTPDSAVIPQGQPQVLANGAPVYLGAWTRIIVRVVEPAA